MNLGQRPNKGVNESSKLIPALKNKTNLLPSHCRANTKSAISVLDKILHNNKTMRCGTEQEDILKNNVFKVFCNQIGVVRHYINCFK